MIQARPFTSLAAMAVFRQLDANDQLEAELVRGAPTHALDLFADWRGAARGCLVNLVIETGGGTPFAVLALAHTGVAGVAEAALLARDHARFRRQLAELAVMIRARMPGWCRENGVRRVEARCHASHPTAPRLLRNLGFVLEAPMFGFGGHGRATFLQFAATFPADPSPAAPAPDPVCPDPATTIIRS